MDTGSGRGSDGTERNRSSSGVGSPLSETRITDLLKVQENEATVNNLSLLAAMRKQKKGDSPQHNARHLEKYLEQEDETSMSSSYVRMSFDDNSTTTGDTENTGLNRGDRKTMKDYFNGGAVALRESNSYSVADTESSDVGRKVFVHTLGGGGGGMGGIVSGGDAGVSNANDYNNNNNNSNVHSNNNNDINNNNNINNINNNNNSVVANNSTVDVSHGRVSLEEQKPPPPIGVKATKDLNNSSRNKKQMISSEYSSSPPDEDMLESASYDDESAAESSTSRTATVRDLAELKQQLDARNAQIVDDLNEQLAVLDLEIARERHKLQDEATKINVLRMEVEAKQRILNAIVVSLKLQQKQQLQQQQLQKR